MTAYPSPVLPPQRDVWMWRGDNDPAVEWRFGDDATPEILAGSEFELTVQWSSGADNLVLRSDDPNTTLGVDEVSRTVTWAYTAGESLDLPRGAHSYELRRLIDGKRRTWVWGTLTVASGLRRG